MSAKRLKGQLRLTKAQLIKNLDALSESLSKAESRESELESELESAPTPCEVQELKRDLQEATDQAAELIEVVRKLTPLALAADRGSAEHILRMAECLPWRYRPPFV